MNGQSNRKVDKCHTVDMQIPSTFAVGNKNSVINIKVTTKILRL